ncbi:hypothetical protein TWF696_002927 [Orbilia brochopaga]|uniref:Uncharacterized protein n=1 Tax=Orbilia brochopaga TaxID=3140254 RepID=A0AAV9U4E4_9PEZI
MKVTFVLLATIASFPSLSLAQAAAGGGVLAGQTTPPATMVWVTVTDALGSVQTIQTVYSQVFSPAPPMMALKSGQIGLGQWATEKPAKVTGAP